MTAAPTSGARPRPATARLAAAADAESVAALRAEAIAELAPLRGGPLYAAREAVELPQPGSADRPLWVGELDGVVVGYAAARIDGLPGGRRLGVIEAVYVTPACRAVGVGEAMIELAITWCRAEGCSGVDARALPGARATKNFFEESGFTARLLVMHRSLEGKGPTVDEGSS
jgi:GNAT superfamily N-acetyltransferase